MDRGVCGVRVKLGAVFIARVFKNYFISKQGRTMAKADGVGEVVFLEW